MRWFAFGFLVEGLAPRTTGPKDHALQVEHARVGFAGREFLPVARLLGEVE
jgi:hypothetical protein